MDIRFKLKSDDIFIWKYEGFSELIDNLEPEPDSIIEVIEPFTIEDFEIAYVEYKKFILFKIAVNDVINHIKLWDSPHLIDLSKFDIENKILVWLVIKETKEENEFKKRGPFLSSGSQLENWTDSDNILICHIIKTYNSAKFLHCCKFGMIKCLQWLYLFKNNKITNSILNDCFVVVCEYGHFDIAKWLYNLGIIDINYDENMAFTQACRSGNLEIVQWIYNISKPHLRHLRMILYSCCSRGNFNLILWLYSVYSFSKEDISNPFYDIFHPFISSLINGYYDICKWMFDNNLVDVYDNDEEIFKNFCNRGDLKIAKWLYDLSKSKTCFKTDFRTSHEEINIWLDSLC